MFYKKCEAHQALVRTGCCGPRVVIGGGLWVFPYFHQLDSVDLAVKCVTVEISGERPVRTRDEIPSRLKAVFFLRVNPTLEDVMNVASFLGTHAASDAGALSELFVPKFSDILYRVAGQLTFDEIQRDREAFVNQVLKTIGADLQGLVLDDCALEYFEKL